MNSNISFSELLKMDFAHIIDIRSIDKYQNGHVPGALHYDYQSLLFTPERYLNKNDVYYIYCDSGNRSFSLCKTLNHLGYHTVNVLGGYQNYLFSF